MNKQISLVIVFLLLIGACKQPESQEQIFYKLLTEALAEHPDAIGILAHIEATDKGISWSGAVGHHDMDSTGIIQANQPALIASITKTYMAVAILRLAEQDSLRLDQEIQGLTSARTDSLLKHYAFDPKAIQIQHLLSHKSGLPDYVPTEEFLNKLRDQPAYRWTRDEQIELALKQGPINGPGTSFNYGDVNYLILGEVIEHFTGKPFNKALVDLLDFNNVGLDKTWFYSLDDFPKNTLPLIHQYASAGTEDSYTIDNSFDLYGGGGIATTTEDLARFISALFSGKILGDKTVLNLMFQDVPTSAPDQHEDFIQGVPCQYYMGIQSCPYEDSSMYWHLGYWGTVYRYFPAYKITITIFVVNQEAFEEVDLYLTHKLMATISKG